MTFDEVCKYAEAATEYIYDTQRAQSCHNIIALGEAFGPSPKKDKEEVAETFEEFALAMGAGI